MPAPSLTMIIGHLTDTTARVWIQGSESHPSATVTLTDIHGTTQKQRLALRADRCFTGVVDFEDLAPDTGHTCLLLLQGSPGTHDKASRGGFRTFPKANTTPRDFTFGLVSCNARTLKTRRDYFEHFWKRARGEARFVIHAGDNIYYDKKPNEGQTPTLQRYADTYNRVWGKPSKPKKDINRSIRSILSETANYMILDDHDITNNFSPTDDDLAPFAVPGRKAYELFQHAHNPDSAPGSLYYDFAYGDVRFFVMDVRFERDAPEGLMISQAQERAFLAWAEAHADALKFVVTPVPILGQTVPVIGDQEDKWCGKRFRTQRNRIVSTLADRGIERLVFLTGDMHASYHLRTTLTKGGERRVYHELMSGPIDHFLRSRLAFNPDDAWSAGGWKASAKGFTNFSAKKSAMLIQVNPDARIVSYTAIRTKRNKVLWSSGFSL